MVAQTSTKTPALRTMVTAIFFNVFKLDFQSIGIGTKIKYGSVARFAAKVTQMMGIEIAGWQMSRERMVD